MPRTAFHDSSTPSSFGADTERGDRLAGALGIAIEAAFIALLAFLPCCFGGVEAWAEEAAFVLTGVIALLFLARAAVSRHTRLRFAWALFPVTLFLGLAVLQLLPLSPPLAKSLSPNTVTDKTRLLLDLSGAPSSDARLPLSFYPRATRHDLRLILAVSVVFAVALQFYRRRDRILRLLSAISIIGGAVALLALAQDLTGTEQIFWSFPGVHPKARSGPFVHYSHFSQFMNMCIGAALGLMLYLRRAGEHEDALSSHRRRVAIGLLLTMMVASAAAIFLSLSRGGMLSLVISLGFTAAALTLISRIKGHGWILATLLLAAFAVLLYSGFNSVYGRLATLRNLPDRYQDRWQILKDIGVIFRRFPVFGTGLGTHEFVYPAYDRSSLTSLATHAENEYAQVLEEGGVIGLTAVLLFAVIVWARYFQSIRRPEPPVRVVAFGLGFGLLAVMIQSFSDFGQHLPANAFLTAAVCALIINLARIREQPVARQSSPAVRWVLVSVCSIALLLGWAWMLVTADRARRGESAFRSAEALAARLEKREWQGDNEEYADLINEARTAAEAEPDNVTYQHRLNVYRWYSISRVRDAKTGGVVLTSQQLDYARRIAAELNAARRLCPTFGPLLGMAGQIETFVLDDSHGPVHIELAQTLAPHNPIIAFAAGQLAVRRHDWAKSLTAFGEYLKLWPNHREVVEVYVRADRPDLAVSIAGDNADALLASVAAMQQHQVGGQWSTLLEQTRSRARALKMGNLNRAADGANPPAAVFAQRGALFAEDGDHARAATDYRRAADLDFGNASYHLELATHLLALGQRAEAAHEVEIVLRLEPSSERARQLQSQINGK